MTINETQNRDFHFWCPLEMSWHTCRTIQVELEVFWSFCHCCAASPLCNHHLQEKCNKVCTTTGCLSSYVYFQSLTYSWCCLKVVSIIWGWCGSFNFHLFPKSSNPNIHQTVNMSPKFPLTDETTHGCCIFSFLWLIVLMIKI